MENIGWLNYSVDKYLEIAEYNNADFDNEIQRDIVIYKEIFKAILHKFFQGQFKISHSEFIIAWDKTYISICLDTKNSDFDIKKFIDFLKSHQNYIPKEFREKYSLYISTEFWQPSWIFIDERNISYIWRDFVDFWNIDYYWKIVFWNTNETFKKTQEIFSHLVGELLSIPAV